MNSRYLSTLLDNGWQDTKDTAAQSNSLFPFKKAMKTGWNQKVSYNLNLI